MSFQTISFYAVKTENGAFVQNAAKCPRVKTENYFLLGSLQAPQNKFWLVDSIEKSKQTNLEIGVYRTIYGKPVKQKQSEDFAKWLQN